MTIDIKEMLDKVDGNGNGDIEFFEFADILGNTGKIAEDKKSEDTKKDIHT